MAVDRFTRFQPLALGILAALTPSHWDIEIIDEKWSPFTFRPADLVGITAFTGTAPRAYELAKIYREKNISVVMGGIHPLMRTEEAQKFVDTVVLGEAENVWPQLIRDFESGNLQPVYRGGHVDMAVAPAPRRDLFHPRYLAASVQTARGCPMDCEFCSVPAFNGRRQRHRPVGDVLEELASAHQKLVFFTDDNLVGHGKQSLQRTIELLKGMAEHKLKKWWICQASINFADSDELLYWARRSGCKLVFLGIEALEEDGLREVNKYLNMERREQYLAAFEKINRAGIGVLGSFVFGLDSDTPEILKDRESFILSNHLDVIQATVITPLPGTRLFRRLETENRLLHTGFPADWYLYDFDHVVHRPLGMSPEQLSFAITRCHKRMSSYPVILRKAFHTLRKTRSLSTALLALQSNRIARKIAKVLY